MLLMGRQPLEVRLATWDRIGVEALTCTSRAMQKTKGKHLVRMDLTDAFLKLLRRASGSAKGRGSGVHVLPSYLDSKNPFAKQPLGMSLKRAGYERIEPVDVLWEIRAWVREDRMLPQWERLLKSKAEERRGFLSSYDPNALLEAPTGYLIPDDQGQICLRLPRPTHFHGT